jgi:hypothetical protein
MMGVPAAGAVLFALVFSGRGSGESSAFGDDTLGDAELFGPSLTVLLLLRALPIRLLLDLVCACRIQALNARCFNRDGSVEASSARQVRRNGEVWYGRKAGG